MRSGPIIIVEDDETDQELICDALDELGVKNERILLQNGAEALDYLRTTTDKPFIIICDINLPRMSGTELRTAVNSEEYLRRKCIPFIFFSTNANHAAVSKAYDESVQGFFVKGNSFKEIKDKISLMVSYWTECLHPNSMREV